MRYRAPGFLLPLFQRLFDALDEGNERLAARQVTLLFGRIFRGCTPAFAEPYRIDRTGNLCNRLSAWIYLAALVHCLLLTAALAAINGTFLPAAGDSIEFLEDKANIALYLLVCPAYVTLCIRLLLLAIERDPADVASRVACTPADQGRRVFLCLFLISLMSSVLITGYVNDALDPDVIPRSYWFVDERQGVRSLNSAGLYYIVLNFTLLFITFLGGAAFISISLDGIRLSRDLVRDDSTELDFATYKKRLDRLVHAYFWGVLLVACYALNTIIWKHSPLGGTANIDIAGAMLTVLGILFVAIPRRFIEHTWASYCARKALLQQSAGEAEHCEVISSDMKRVVQGATLGCVGGWFPNFYDIKDYVDPYHWLGVFFGA